jgi:UDP-N-acetylmuramyl pentapeptide phosphotransferase/UDP-N-acetylglucosamine-1-phosphate transferase
MASTMQSADILPLSCSSTTEGYPMDLISLVVVLIVVGVLLWLVNNYIPMDGKIKNILNIVVVVAVVVWLLNALGLMDSIRGIRVGR